MTSRAFSHIAAAVSLAIFSVNVAAAQSSAKGEYAKHFAPLAKLSVAVAEATPADQYGFRPHPDSMTFGELMSHIATTNYQFCTGLKDFPPPAMPTPTTKDAIVNFLSDSFAYCAAIIPNLTKEQFAKAHDSPDGHLPGRDILLAMYSHPMVILDLCRVSRASSRPGGDLPSRQGHQAAVVHDLNPA